MEKRILKKILRVSEKAAKEYEKTEKEHKGDKELPVGLLFITCRALEEIEKIVRKGLEGK